MNIGDKVRVKRGPLGGYDNQGCDGRPAETSVPREMIGVVVRPADWLPDYVDWWVARFVVGDEVLFVPCVEPDHVEVIA